MARFPHDEGPAPDPHEPDALPFDEGGNPEEPMPIEQDPELEPREGPGMGVSEMGDEALEDGFQIEDFGKEEVEEPKTPTEEGSFTTEPEGLQRDSFEQWARLAKQYEILDPEELERLAPMVRDEDPETAEWATEKLVRHNIRWILRCAYDYAGNQVMNRPGELRNEVLAEARLGFVIGLQKYDEERALNRGQAGHRKSILKYTELWIRKRVGALLKREQFGLNVDAALDREKVVRADKALSEQLGRPPTDEEIRDRLEKQARERLNQEREGKGDRAPGKELRKKGALTLDRVKELRRHQTDRISLEDRTSDDEDAPTLGDFLASSDRSPDEEAARRDTSAQISSVIRNTIPGRINRMVLAMANGMSNEKGTDHYPVLNDEELGFIQGTTRDTVRNRRAAMENQMRGRTTAALETLRKAEGEHRSVKEWEAMGREERERKLKASLELPEILAFRSGPEDLKCLTDSCDTPLPIDESDEEVPCPQCGRVHDLIDLAGAAARSDHASKPTRDECLAEATWMAAGIRPEDRDGSRGKIVGTTNPNLDRRLRRML